MSQIQILVYSTFAYFLVSKHVQTGPEVHPTSTGVISGGKRPMPDVEH
jgi:hypothetical protein